MAGGIHASSPGSATVTHQMGHSVLPPEYALHSQTVLENGVPLNEATNSIDVNVVESSTSRKRKHSADATNHQLESKRTCIYNQLLTDMILEKEKYLYFWLLNEYSHSDENDFLGFVNKIKFSDPFLPSPNPQHPKSVYFSSEPESFQKLFPSEVVSELKTVRTIKQESNESVSLFTGDYDAKSTQSPVLIRTPFRQPSVSGDRDSNSQNNSQQIVEKAKQEAQVYQRISELQKLGLWTEKRLPKVQEPPRAKAHWDYVLEELEWLAADFAQERKWKKAAARKRSRMIQKHFQEREALVQKTARAAELHRRKIASHLAKIVKSFWNNVEKLVDFKQQTKLKEKRQQALDQHLSFIVDKTEKYSSLVAESMSKSAVVAQENSRSHSPVSDVEFEPNQTSSDDEETIEAEEKGNSADTIDHTKELEMLKRESQLPLEDLLNQLPEEYLNDVDKLKPSDKVAQRVDDDDEYEMEADVSDDETTLLEEENIQGAVDYKSEIAELEADNDLSIEELMKKYNATSVDSLGNSTPSSHADSTSESDEQEESNDSSSDDDDTEDDEKLNDDEESDGLMSLLKDSTLENGDINDENADEKIDNVAAIAESIQPKGNTLSSTCVVTKVPFLLKHSLREYQHIGLDWLVTMYERQLNGILADEMGLGKTIQTIALLAHLASDKENWGPHLIIVPTSVMLNWEMEFKKWCPAFKILTYYGNPKERKLKRAGWTKPNTFHVCITSYKLVLQDHHCFRRKKWKYLILDEAQNIKNFKSQRWQRLLNFDSERRLLLTGTPLQNNLMELWSLMHFLMPNLFSSHREFKEWFSNPVTGMIEGNSEYNENIIKRLHKVLRPFLLRRLKTEVEKQLPSKYEHIVMCRLSNRQRFLYDDFMSRAKTKETLSAGNLLSVINVLMQLRKVCNHPNLFEQRPIISPFQMENINYHTASLVDSALDYDPSRHVNLNALNLQLISLENELTAWSVYRMKRLKLPRKLIEEISESPDEAPPVPKGKLNIRLKTPGDLNCIQVDGNVKNNQKITNFLKNTSISASSTNNVRMSTPIGTPVKVAPIFRTIIGQGEMNSMAVKRNKPVDNATANRGSYAVQVKSAKGSTVPSKLCFTTGTKSIHAVIRPVSLKNTAAGAETMTTLTVSPSTGNSSSISTVTASTISSSVIDTLATMSGIVPTSSVIAVSSGSSTPKLTNSLSPLVTTTGKQFMVSQPSNTVVKSGQRVILTKSVSGNPNSIFGSFIRIPNSSVQQGSILNNGGNSNVSTTIPSSTIILNNSLKPSISIPKPISTPTVTSSLTSANTSSSISSSTVTRSRAEKSKNELLPEAAEVKERRKRSRKEKLRILADANERKSNSYVMFGCDVRTTLKILDANSHWEPVNDEHYWKCTGHVNCVNAAYAKHVHNLCLTLTNALANSVKSIEERIQELSDTFSRYIVYVPAVNARRPTMHVSHPAPSKAWSLSYMECMLEKDLAPRSKSLHQIVSRMSTAFPDSRLIQYDCGKLQTLDTLLRRLKLEQHRVLIFTQMARMLDVLEAFLTFHGHIYLRLDGSTRIDQRQVLMERFNADKRYFCFILSTRSGGIGVNLTGADTVIFYDSDWNPTMDAQAQDRCHRIGQTRDVHIYRLISEKTVEENILKKANQKKLLGDLAIEGGNFTAAYFKSTTIHDLFNVDFDEADPAKRISDVASDSGNAQVVEKSTLNAYESALAAAEDEPDVAAARTAKEEAVAELAEFDENIPLVDNDTNPESSMPPEEVSKAEQEVAALIEQLTPIERWALRFMETVDAEWAEEQLAAAEAEIEQQKKEWELERIAIEQADARSKRLDEELEDDDVPLTYSSDDAKNQTWISLDSADYMPIWLPLPALFSIEDTENYVDRSVKYLYDTVAIPEHLLPPIYLRKEKKKLRLDQSSSNLISESTTHIRVRSRHRDGLSSATLSVASLEPPKSLFDRPSAIVAKLRQDMRLQKYRGLPRSTIPNVPGLKPYFPPKVNADPEFVPDWLIHEDYALLQAIQHVQELPLNLSVMYPGHVANWDLVSELVNQVSRIYRSPQQCKNRFESAILPREEGKLTSDPITKKQKKLKGLNQMVSHSKYTRNCKTAQLYLQDSNNTFTQMMNTRFDAIRGVSNRRAPTIKRLPLTTSTKNPKHAQLLVECDIDYDRPLTPVEIAAKRAQRLAKEKQTQLATAEQLLLRQGNAQQQQLAKQHQAQQQPAIQQLQQPVIMQQLQSQLTAQKTIPISTTQTAVVVNISQNSAITSASPVTIRSIGHRPINEMIVVSSNQPAQSSAVVISQTKPTTTMATTNLISSSNIQRIIPITQITTTGTVPTSRIVTTSNKPASQIQLYKHQQAIQQHQLKILHPRSKTPVVVPTNVVVSSPQPQRQQQSPQQQQQSQQQQQQVQQQHQQQQQQQQRQITKSVATAVASPGTKSLDTELAIVLRKQQLQQQQQKFTSAAVIATTNTPTVQTQFITTQAAGALGKSTVGVTLPTMKTATIGASNIKASPTAPQHIRQITIQQQQVQQRKLQRVTPIGQVMVNVTQSGQGISHVLTKGIQGNVATGTHVMGARVIPVVVNASALRAATSPNVTIDSTGTRHIQQTLPSNTIKISGSPSTLTVASLSQQQQLLNQLVQNQSLVRQGNLKIQNTGIVSATQASASGTVTLPSPNQIINMPATQSQTPTSEKKGL